MSCQRVNLRNLLIGRLPAARWLVFLAVTLCAMSLRVSVGLAEDEINLCESGDPGAPAEALELAVEALVAGDVASALQTLRALSGAFPQDLKVQYYLSRAEQANGDALRALAAAKAAYFSAPGCRPVIAALGKLLEMQGDFDEAASVYSEAVNRWPEDADFREKLAGVLVAASKLDEAAPHLQWLKNARAEDAEMQARWAELQGWRGVAEDCVAGFEEAIALDATVMSALRFRTWADAQKSLGQVDEAVATYEKALELDPNDMAAKVGRAYALMEAERAAEAVDTFRALVRQAPGSSDFHAGLARAYHAAGHIEEASAAYKQAIRTAPRNDALRLEAAQVIASSETGREDALALLQPLIEVDAPKSEHLLARAQILSWIPERRVEALDVVSLLLARDSNFVEAWEVARNVILWLPPRPELLAWMERLAKRYPRDVGLKRRLATVLVGEAGRAQEAEALLEEVIRKSPGDYEAHLLRAELRYGMDPNGEGVAEGFLEASRLARSDPDIQARAGNGLFALGRPKDALACFVKGCQADPGHVGCTIGRVDALVALGRYEEAQVVLRDALARKQNRATRATLETKRASLENLALRQQAQRLEAEGRLEAAEMAYRSLLARNPRDVDTWNALGALNAKRGDFDDALRAFQKALSLAPDNIGALQGAAGSHLASRRFDEAEALIKRELALATSADARQRLARLQLLRQVDEAQQIMRDGRPTTAVKQLGRLYLANPNEPVVVLAYGDALASTGQHPAAADAYVRAVTLDRGNLAALSGAASSLWEAGKREEARYYLEELRRLSPRDELATLDAQLLGWLVEEGEYLKVQGDFPEALEKYREAYLLAKTRDFVLKGVGGLYWENGQVGLASKFYVQAASLYPEDVDAVTAAIETLLARNLPDLALSLLESNQAIQGDERLEGLQGRAQLARDLMGVEAAWRRGEYALAETLAAQVEQLYPDKVEPRIRLAQLFGTSAQYAQAIRWYYKVLEVAPDHQPALLGLIATLQAAGRFVEAQDLVDQARNIDKTLGRETQELDRLEAAGFAVRARVARKKGQLEDSLEAYVKAVELGFDEPWLLLAVAEIYQATGQPDDARRVYETVLSRHAANVDALRGKALALLELNRVQELEATLLQIESLALPSPADQSIRAEWLKLSGRMDEALELYEHLYQDNPGDIDVCRGLVGCYLAVGRPQKALEILIPMLPSIVDDPTLLESTASALTSSKRSALAVPVLRRLNLYWGTEARRDKLEHAYQSAYIEEAETAKLHGELPRARKLYREAHRRWPERVDVLRGLAGVEASMGHHQAAINYFEQVLVAKSDDPVALGGAASNHAAMGEVQSALDSLRDAWEESHHPLVGLELADLLVGQERYYEAERVLQDVDQALMEMEEAEDEGEEEVGVGVENISSRFLQAWQAAPRGVPSTQILRVGIELPPWPPDSLDRLDTAPAEEPTSSAVRRSGSRSLLLPDIAPELPMPVYRSVAPRTGDTDDHVTIATRLDLRLVEQLLKELRTDPDALLDASDDASAGRTVPGEPVSRAPRPVASSAPSRTHLELYDEELPFVPTISRDAPETERHQAAPLTPYARLDVLRQKVAWARANRLEVGGWVDGRSGESGYAYRFAAFGDVRARLFPTSALYFEPYVSPGLVTDGDETGEGVMMGLGFGIRPHRFHLQGHVGTSPIGFVGGYYTVGRVALDVDLVDRFRIGIEGAIEPITDSLLSWAGELYGGDIRGQVRRNRLGAYASLRLDGRTSMSLGGDVAQYVDYSSDENMWRNGWFGMDHRIPMADGQKLGIGVNLTVFHFDEQLDSFPGNERFENDSRQAGYFSPTLFVVSKGRGTYSDRIGSGHFGYNVLLELGMQYTDCEETNYCTPGTRAVVTFGLGSTYRISRSLEMGASYSYDNVGPWQHSYAQVFVRKRFGVGRDQE